MEKKVVIIEEDCMGCEACVELCPEIFEFDDDKEIAVVLNPLSNDEDCIEDAMDSCPSECIIWEE